MRDHQLNFRFFRRARRLNRKQSVGSSAQLSTAQPERISSSSSGGSSSGGERQTKSRLKSNYIHKCRCVPTVCSSAVRPKASALRASPRFGSDSARARARKNEKIRLDDDDDNTNSDTCDARDKRARSRQQVSAFVIIIWVRFARQQRLRT